MNKPPPLDRDYNRDPKNKALKRREFVNHEFTLLYGMLKIEGLGSILGILGRV